MKSLKMEKRMVGWDLDELEASALEAMERVPDSDDEDIVMGEEDPRKLKGVQQRPAKKRRAESNLQRWIKQLTILFKEEQRKVRSSSLLLASE